MFLLMMLFATEDQCVLRLADLIQMDAYTWWEYENPGKASYNIKYAYTYIRGEANLKYSQILPIPSLTDPSKPTFSFGNVNRVIYRGY